MKHYCSDLHLFDLYAAQRRKKTLVQMNEDLLRPIYALPREDDLYIVGDVCRHAIGETMEALSKAACRLHLVWGNHDKNSIRECNIWSSSLPYAEHKDINGTGKVIPVILFHYPIMEWNLMERGSIHLHGHLHSNTLTRNRADVGVDSKHWNGKPVTLADIVDAMRDL